MHKGKRQLYMYILCFCFIVLSIGNVLYESKFEVYAANVITIKSSETKKDIFKDNQYKFNIKNGNNVSYSTSNNKIITVNGKGIFTAKSQGKATIQVKKKGKVLAKCVVTVKIAVNRIILNRYQLTLEEKDTFKIVPQVLPANAHNKKVTYSSNNKKIATVTKDGKVKAIKSGKTKIIVSATDGSKVRSTLNVTVYRVQPSSGKKVLGVTVLEGNSLKK